MMPRAGEGKRVDLSLLEVTHLELGLDHFGLGIIQERDRLGRATRRRPLDLAQGDPLGRRGRRDRSGRRLRRLDG